MDHHIHQYDDPVGTMAFLSHNKRSELTCPILQLINDRAGLGTQAPYPQPLGFTALSKEAFATRHSL